MNSDCNLVDATRSRGASFVQGIGSLAQLQADTVASLSVRHNPPEASGISSYSSAVQVWRPSDAHSVPAATSQKYSNYEVMNIIN